MASSGVLLTKYRLFPVSKFKHFTTTVITPFLKMKVTRCVAASLVLPQVLAVKAFSFEHRTDFLPALFSDAAQGHKLLPGQVKHVA